MKLLRKPILSICGIACLTAAAAATAGQQPNANAARTFVAEFYGWYVPNAPASADALKDKLSDQLYLALKADEEAKAKADGEVTGLDYDPFLNSQDPCPRYEPGAVVPHGDAWRVEVFAVCDGARAARPSALAEVRSVGGRWAFVDVHDADGKHGLIETLKLLAKDR
jgi:hypothetical protein